MRAYLAYTGRRYSVHFWRSYDGVEVDLLCETSNGFVALEINAAQHWDKRFNRGLNRLRDELGGSRVRCFGIYPGTHKSAWGEIRATPALDFLRRLWDGYVIT